MTFSEILEAVKGKTIVDFDAPDKDYEIVLKFDDGVALLIGVQSQYCDDAWLVLELGEDGEFDG